jgi:hypothetical protein
VGRERGGVSSMVWVSEEIHTHTHKIFTKIINICILTAQTPPASWSPSRPSGCAAPPTRSASCGPAWTRRWRPVAYKKVPWCCNGVRLFNHIHIYTAPYPLTQIYTIKSSSRTCPGFNRGIMAVSAPLASTRICPSSASTITLWVYRCWVGELICVSHVTLVTCVGLTFV